MLNHHKKDGTMSISATNNTPAESDQEGWIQRGSFGFRTCRESQLQWNPALFNNLQRTITLNNLVQQGDWAFSATPPKEGK